MEYDETLQETKANYLTPEQLRQVYSAIAARPDADQMAAARALTRLKVLDKLTDG